MSTRSKRQSGKVPGLLAVHFTQDDSSAILPVRQLIGKPEMFYGKNLAKKVQVIYKGTIRESLIIKFSDSIEELKSAISMYFGSDDEDQQKPPPPKRQKKTDQKKKTAAGKSKPKTCLAMIPPPSQLSGPIQRSTPQYHIHSSDGVLNKLKSFSATEDKENTQPTDIGDPAPASPPRDTVIPAPASPPRDTVIPAPASPPRDTVIPAPASPPRETVILTPASPPRDTVIPAPASPPRETVIPAPASPPRETVIPTPASPPRDTVIPAHPSPPRETIIPTPASPPRDTFIPAPPSPPRPAPPSPPKDTVISPPPLPPLNSSNIITTIADIHHSPKHHEHVHPEPTVTPKQTHDRNSFPFLPSPLIHSLLMENQNTCNVPDHHQHLVRIESKVDQIIEFLKSWSSVSPVVQVMQTEEVSLPPPPSPNQDMFIFEEPAVHLPVNSPPIQILHLDNKTASDTQTEIGDPNPLPPTRNMYPTPIPPTTLPEELPLRQVPADQASSRHVITDPKFMDLTITTIIETKPNTLISTMQTFPPAPDHIAESTIQEARGLAGESRQKFAVSLFRSYCSVSDVFKKNIRGKVYQGNKDPKEKINPEKMTAIRLLTQQYYPSPVQEAEKNWTKVIRAIDKANWSFHQHVEKIFDITHL